MENGKPPCPEDKSSLPSSASSLQNSSSPPPPAPTNNHMFNQYSNIKLSVMENGKPTCPSGRLSPLPSGSHQRSPSPPPPAPTNIFNHKVKLAINLYPQSYKMKKNMTFEPFNKVSVIKEHVAHQNSIPMALNFKAAESNKSPEIQNIFQLSRRHDFELIQSKKAALLETSILEQIDHVSPQKKKRSLYFSPLKPVFEASQPTRTYSKKIKNPSLSTSKKFVSDYGYDGSMPSTSKDSSSSESSSTSNSICLNNSLPSECSTLPLKPHKSSLVNRSNLPISLPLYSVEPSLPVMLSMKPTLSPAFVPSAIIEEDLKQNDHISSPLSFANFGETTNSTFIEKISSFENVPPPCDSEVEVESGADDSEPVSVESQPVSVEKQIFIPALADEDPFKLPITIEAYNVQHQSEIQLPKSCKRGVISPIKPVVSLPIASKSKPRQPKKSKLDVSMVSNNFDPFEEVNEEEDGEPKFDNALRFLENKHLWLLEIDTGLVEQTPLGMAPFNRIICHMCDNFFTYETIFKHIVTEVVEKMKKTKDFDIDQSDLCSHCMQNQPTDSDKQFHRLAFSKKGRFGNWDELEAAHICILCPSRDQIEFDNRKDYVDHLLRVHQKNCELFAVCQLCGSRSNSTHDFVYHMHLKHHAIYCFYCLKIFAPLKTWCTDKGYENDTELCEMIYEHIYEHITVQEIFSCDRCDLCFLNSKLLLHHKFNAHTKKVWVPNFGNHRELTWTNSAEDDGANFFNDLRSVITKTARNKLKKQIQPEGFEVAKLLTTYPTGNFLVKSNDPKLRIKSKKKKKAANKAAGIIAPLKASETTRVQDYTWEITKIFATTDFQTLLRTTLDRLVPPNSLVRPSERDMLKLLYCRECGYSLDIPKHFLTRSKKCHPMAENCPYTTCCEIALNLHQDHVPKKAQYKPIKLSGRRVEWTITLTQALEDYQDALDMKNDKILVCRSCNFLAKNLIEAYTHMRLKKHLHIIAYNDKEEDDANKSKETTVASSSASASDIVEVEPSTSNNIKTCKKLKTSEL